MQRLLLLQETLRENIDKRFKEEKNKEDQERQKLRQEIEKNKSENRTLESRVLSLSRVVEEIQNVKKDVGTRPKEIQNHGQNKPTNNSKSVSGVQRNQDHDRWNNKNKAEWDQRFRIRRP